MTGLDPVRINECLEWTENAQKCMKHVVLQEKNILTAVLVMNN